MKIVIVGIFFTCMLATAQQGFKLGLENISPAFLKSLAPNKPLKIGLITNQTGKDQTGLSNIEVLTRKGIQIVYLFAPEHGMQGTQAASATVQNGKTASNIPVVSLYKNGTGAKVDRTYMQEIDALFFDIQDSGMRHYTYISTLFRSIECAASHGKPIVILDRPNPLGCVIEGPLVEQALKSFISIADIPLRHGMTVGELAYYFNNHLMQERAKLYIVPMQNYVRHQGIGTSFLAALSPNITSINSCYGYSFLGLLGEVRPFHVGVGTPEAFQMITLPLWVKVNQIFWEELSEKLKNYGISTTHFTTQHPTRKNNYTGLKIHIQDINNVTCFMALVTVLEHSKKAGVNLQFSASFDKAIGTEKMREYLKDAISKQELQRYVNAHIKAFIQRAKESFYYHPHPSLKPI